MCRYFGTAASARSSCPVRKQPAKQRNSLVIFARSANSSYSPRDLARESLLILSRRHRRAVSSRRSSGIRAVMFGRVARLQERARCGENREEQGHEVGIHAGERSAGGHRADRSSASPDGKAVGVGVPASGEGRASGVLCLEPGGVGSNPRAIRTRDMLKRARKGGAVVVDFGLPRTTIGATC